MISRLKVVEEVYDFLPKGVDFTFDKKINVIVGPNGCGKTTLIKIMRDFMLMDDFRMESNIYSDDIRKYFRRENGRYAYDCKKFEVYSDYANKAFRFPNPTEMWNGQCNGGGMFQLSKAAKGSEGENAEAVLDKLFARIKEQASAFDFQKYYNYSLDTRDHPYIAAHRIPDEGITTVLIDEPDSHLDIFKVKSLAGVLTEDRPGMQLIVVVHNPLLICELAKSGKVNFIEMEDGYVDKVRNAVKEMAE